MVHGCPTDRPEVLTCSGVPAALPAGRPTFSSRINRRFILTAAEIISVAE